MSRPGSCDWSVFPPYGSQDRLDFILWMQINNLNVHFVPVSLVNIFPLILFFCNIQKKKEKWKGKFLQVRLSSSYLKTLLIIMRIMFYMNRSGKKKFCLTEMWLQLNYTKSALEGAHTLDFMISERPQLEIMKKASLFTSSINFVRSSCCYDVQWYTEGSLPLSYCYKQVSCDYKKEQIWCKWFKVCPANVKN